ncbi:uncharacterized protein LOC111040854 isoform X2 [Myzus persicae]|uniref:uncharacterized protein LOC111040854 isoform X2 n=1 Tax=Myzus persicae TaxID=13164 RepID=UPI000B938E23|nr:uncharacterized protein LOC111040854 isoform X2 [Myzus persicae]
MDRKKRSKRSKEESTNNKKKDVKQNKVKDKKSGKKEKHSDNEDNISQGSNQSFCEDQKGSNNIICKKDSDKYELKQNEAHKIDCHEDLKCKPSDDDEKKEWHVKTKHKNKTSHQSLSEEQNNHTNIQKQSKLYDTNSIQENNIDSHEPLTKKGGRRKDKNENNKKTSPQSLSEEQKYHKKIQNQRKLPYKDSNEDYLKKKTAHNRTNSDSQKDTRISVTKDGEERWRDKNKNNNGEKQSRFSDIEKSIFEEIDEDIFKLSKDYSLAHCVAEDLRMGAGIAVDFKRSFGGVGKLVDQKLKVGDVGTVKRHDQYAFYLVTKKSSNGKPTMVTMEKALHSLLNKMKENNLTKLGIPKIGCGLDKLDWSETKLLINKIFYGSGIHITVCVPSKLLDSKKTQKLKVYITPKHLWQMQQETIIILFIDLEQIYKKNWTDPIIDAVDAKYPLKENLLRYVKDKKLDPGDIKRFDVKNEIIFCIFTTQSTYYGSLENGFKEINKIKNYNYLAIESGPIDYPSDKFQHISWIVLIFRSVIHFSELWLCGNVKQSETHVFYDEYCRNVQYPMNHSFQYNSPTQGNYRYNDDFHSFSTK